MSASLPSSSACFTPRLARRGPREQWRARMAEAAPHAASVATDEQQQQRESYDSCASPIDGSASDPFLSESRFSSPNALSTRSTADLTVRQCTRNQAAFNIFLYMFGATQIPYAIGQMGWIWGTVFMGAMSVSSYHSGHLLADICVRRRAYSWPAIGLVGFGAAGQYAIETLQTTNFVLSGVVQTQGAGSVWQQAGLLRNPRVITCVLGRSHSVAPSPMYHPMG